MSLENVLDIARDYAAGKIERADYWRRMQQFHTLLQDYCRLIAGKHLEAIEIDNSGLYLRLQNGLRTVWRPEDIRTVPNILVNHGVYEAGELAVMEALAPFCQTALDVGANEGWYSLHLARFLAPRRGAVYSFEPVPATFGVLKRNIELNGFGNIVFPFNLALGESSGVVSLFIPKSSGSVAASRRLLFPDDVNEQVESQVMKLDEFVTEKRIARIDFIKCDVEGAEILVLRGGLETIEEHRPVIMLEMLRKWAREFDYHPNDVIDLLGKYGYSCWSLDDEGVRRISQVDEATTQTNFLFMQSPDHDSLLAALDYLVCS